jgi:hypothetical protein
MSARRGAADFEALGVGDFGIFEHESAQPVGGVHVLELNVVGRLLGAGFVNRLHPDDILF